MGRKWSRASLRISSKSLTCAEITAALRTEPTVCFERGAPVRSAAGGPKREESLWIMESGLNDAESLERHLQYLVEFVSSKSSQLSSIRPRCDMEVFCAFASETGQGGVTLPSNLLKAIAAIPMDLSLDLYPPE